MSLSADDNAPLTLRGEDVKQTIIQPARYAIFLTEPIHGLLLFTEPYAGNGAAVTHTIAGCPGLFRSGELPLVLFANSADDLAVRKVEYLLIAFDAVEYHGNQLLLFVCPNYTNI